MYKKNGGYDQRTFPGLVGSILAIGLSGCSYQPLDTPNDKDGYGPSVAQVVDKIQCEISEGRNLALSEASAKAARKQPVLDSADKVPGFDKWTAAVNISLTVNDTGGLSPLGGVGLTRIDPIKSAVSTSLSRTIGGSIVLYQQRQHIFTQSYTIDISKIPLTQSCADKKDWHRSFNLEGELGIREAIGMGLRSLDTDDAARYDMSSKPDNFGMTTSFDVYKGITSAGPSWVLVHLKGPLGGLGYTTDQLNKVAISFVPPSPPRPTPAATKSGAKAVPQQPKAMTDAKTQTQGNAIGALNTILLNSAIQQLNQSINKQ